MSESPHHSALYAPARDGTSWEDLLADPMWQTPFDSELLPHLLAFGPPVDIEVRRCRCATVHIGTPVPAAML